MSHHMAIMLPFNKMPFTGPVCPFIPERCCRCPGRVGESQRHGQGKPGSNPPLASQGFLVPPTPHSGPSCREQSLDPSRVDGRSETSAGMISFMGNTDNALEVGLSGFVQTATHCLGHMWWHLGTWG